MDLKELAEQTSGYFESRQRGTPKPGEDPEMFWTMKSYRPVWVREMVYRVHDDGHFSPDDFKYRTIMDVLDAIAEGQGTEDLNLEPDIYNSDLLDWLGSHLERAGYVDEATKEYGHGDQGIMGDIGQGQWYEKDQIARIVVETLTEELERIDLGDPQEMEDAHESKKEGPKEWSPKKWKKRGK